MDVAETSTCKAESLKDEGFDRNWEQGEKAQAGL